MARDTDRKKISEAVRLQGVWKRHTFGALNYGPGGSYVELVTDCDEALYVEYTKSGQIRRVTYRHWDGGKPGYPMVCTESPKREKLAYVLHHLGVKRGQL